MKETLEKLIPEMLKQAPAVGILLLILVHQQQQINWLFEKCLT